MKLLAGFVVEEIFQSKSPQTSTRYVCTHTKTHTHRECVYKLFPSCSLERRPNLATLDIRKTSLNNEYPPALCSTKKNRTTNPNRGNSFFTSTYKQAAAAAARSYTVKLEPRHLRQHLQTSSFSLRVPKKRHSFLRSLRKRKHTTRHETPGDVLVRTRRTTTGRHGRLKESR